MSTPPSLQRLGWWLTGLALAACVSVSSASANASTNASAPDASTAVSPALPSEYFMPYNPGTYRLAVGDVVEISVFGFPETVAVTPVAPDGHLYYLFLDGIPASGKSPAEVARDIEQRIGAMFNHPTVSILPQAFSENRILILGKVVLPGAYALDSALTLRQSIARAGGLAQGIYRGTTVELASLKDSHVIRDGQKLPIDLYALIYRNDATQDIYMRPGDVVVIASGLGQEVFLMGAVGEQRASAYKDGMTLVELISGSSESGGGYRASARLRSVLIVRGALDQPEAFTVNLARILKGRDPDVMLMPGDIVYVPEKPFAFTRELTRAVVLSFVRTFVAEAGATLVDETIFRPLVPTELKDE